MIHVAAMQNRAIALQDHAIALQDRAIAYNQNHARALRYRDDPCNARLPLNPVN